MKPLPRICFVVHKAYSALCGAKEGHIGGIERQTTIMAHWLASQGYDTSVITWDEGQPDFVTVDGVRVIKTCREKAGAPGVRFFYPRWTGLLSALRKADADLYYQNGADYVTGQVALWCRSQSRRFVFSVASNTNVCADLPHRRVYERWLYRYGIKHADRILVQTRWQRETLRRSFGLDSAVIPMPCPGPRTADYVQRASFGEVPRILWVGRITPGKRLDRLLDIADQCPDLQFDVVGPLVEEEYGRRMVERAARLPNVTMYGRLAPDQMPALYRRAACLCCTSAVEGFPNTFLEAWSEGLPVVSTLDVDDLLSSRGLGVQATDVPGLIQGMRSLLSSPDRWRRTSEKAREYFAANHQVDAAMRTFAAVFGDVTGIPSKSDGTPPGARGAPSSPLAVRGEGRCGS
jgi:glycosyltransferase involved in cell wall biosynthesis